MRKLLLLGFFCFLPISVSAYIPLDRETGGVNLYPHLAEYEAMDRDMDATGEAYLGAGVDSEGFGVTLYDAFPPDGEGPDEGPSASEALRAAGSEALHAAADVAAYTAGSVVHGVAETLKE